MWTVGVDPDLHDTAFAFLENGKVQAVACVSIPSKMTGRRAVLAMSEALLRFEKEWLPAEPSFHGFAVETQELYLGKTKKPDNVMILAYVSGMAISILTRRALPGCIGHAPQPKAWKGQVPKRIHQVRTLTRLECGGLRMHGSSKDGYASPNTPFPFIGREPLMSDYKHITDAIGLGVWAHNQLLHKKVTAADRYVIPTAI